jgi:hypothetical protein
MRPIKVGDLISEATSIIDVVEVLAYRPRAFVLVQNRIGGYVHFSDLNRPIVKLPFFVLLEAVERYFFNKLASAITLETLSKVLDAPRVEALSKKMEVLKKKRSNLNNWAALLGFKELLLCAHWLGAIETRVSELDSLSKVRNLVCHAATTDLLVEQYSHVRRLANAKKLCLGLLEP